MAKQKSPVPNGDRLIKFRAWVARYKVMIEHREVIERAHLQFNDQLTGTLDRVMQYVGLEDKNGTEVFEGDIVAVKFYPAWVQRVSWKGEPDAIAEVYWDLSGFRLKAHGEKDFRYPGLEEVDWDESEVLGNIYQTPQILKNVTRF